jgi:hypothetical protein
MEPKKTDADSTTAKASGADPDHRLATSGGAATGAGEKAGRTRGAAIGGAIGHAIGVGRDVVVGAVSGGIAAGKSAAGMMTAEPFHPSDEHEFWRKEYKDRPYFVADTPYEQYGPAFQFGWESCLSHKGKTFKDVEAQLERDWERQRGQSKLSWDHARNAVRDAWQRVEKNCMSGDCCI